jgi:hypothetical protein
MYADVDQIPSELKTLDTFLTWKAFDANGGKKIKSPVSSEGYKAAYDAPDVLMPFESARQLLSKGNDLGIGISLLNGIEISVGNDSGYLWCLDFDGFINPESNKVDDGVNDFISTFNSYTEISPSGTGFKFFFVCGRKPQSKYKIKFGPSEFAEKYPNITKYSQREIEVFSCKLFLALTGDLYDSLTGGIRFLSATELDSMLERLNNWAIDTGGTGISRSEDFSNNVTSSSNNRSYCRLIKSSLEDVLSHVDHFDEQVWTDVANLLARVYAEEGRSYFHSYSSGVYAGASYPNYDKEECNVRFNRALRELESRSDGYGIKHLISLAEINPDWDNPKLIFEEENPFEKISSAFDYKETRSIQNILATSDDSSIGKNLTPLERLKRYSLTGKSEVLKKQMLDDVFVMEKIAILGQWTVLYAAPGTGKTLLTLWMLIEQIKNGIIDGRNIYYVNADDNFRGMIEKLQISEIHAMQMLSPDINNLSIEEVINLMSELVSSGEASGVILVLDTLKKFTNLMDKTLSSAFGRTARKFTMGGGSLIVLAHTNKHKGEDGKSIHSGTSDIVDDADCVFIIDKIGEHDEFVGKKITVEFTKHKARGDVSDVVGFSYKKESGQSYTDLLDSIERIDEPSLELSKQQIRFNADLKKDEAIISAALIAIKIGINTKDKLIKEVRENTSESSKRVTDVIEKRAGNDYAEGDRWLVKRGDNNSHIFSILPHPLNVK